MESRSKSSDVPEQIVGMLRVMLLAFLFVGFCGAVRAQTWAEFFNQKKTQKQYLVRQLAALEMYAGYARKGYELVSGGLETIKGITRGELGLHEVFFGSLSAVSPLVSGDSRVAGVLRMQLLISARLTSLGSLGALPAAYEVYGRKVRADLLKGCAEDLVELADVLSQGRLQLSDEERLRRLQMLYASVEERYGFCNRFVSAVQVLAKQRSQEKAETEHLRALFGQGLEE
ncbi:hypothetical protein GS399_05530 [Pedobacter sp. HMF7647]|uniref:TerB family tellurite resistance protein n=1 Tax=Hufsiella arboris TaxID=2695275 RepID=A0A7K1Y785_9SPHI|nr:hypothetical protein [Hufsiella arboris]MXV50427.1 hypothetical protein [Hufsiella arboris]